MCSEPRRGSGTILIIDDEDVVRQAARAALEKSGFEVLTAENGQAGVDLFKDAKRTHLSCDSGPHDARHGRRKGV